MVEVEVEARKFKAEVDCDFLCPCGLDIACIDRVGLDEEKQSR